MSSISTESICVIVLAGILYLARLAVRKLTKEMMR